MVGKIISVLAKGNGFHFEVENEGKITKWSWVAEKGGDISVSYDYLMPYKIVGMTIHEWKVDHKTLKSVYKDKEIADVNSKLTIDFMDKDRKRCVMFKCFNELIDLKEEAE